MDSFSLDNAQSNELRQAEAHLWSHILSLHNSMALRCAIELGIPDAIHKHGKPITLAELATILAIHPAKAPALHRLMRFLVYSNFFSRKSLENGEPVFDLTVNSRILLKDNPLSLAPLALFTLDRVIIESASNLSSWFGNATESPFHFVHKRSFWEYVVEEDSFSQRFKQAMASGTKFDTSLLMKDDGFMGAFKGIESIVDVGGGDGSMGKAIAEAFPEMKCTVLDLPQVVQGLKASNCPNLTYVGGDMFEAIPPAQVILLKWVLHNWNDENCIKILERCKEAIPSKEEGGKVMIMDIVMIEDPNESHIYSNLHMFLDMQMMCNTVGGKERTQEEWQKLFIVAGFKDYKLIPISGVLSLIELYP